MITLFEDIHLIDGFNRSIILDTTRGSNYFISLKWSRIIRYFNGKLTENEINDYLSKGKNDDIKELFHFLKKNEMFFDIDKNTLDCFPPIELKFETPSYIDILTIEISKQNINDVINVLENNCLGYIRTYRFFIYKDLSINNVISFFKMISNRSPAVITVYMDEKFKFLCLEKNVEQSHSYRFYYYNTSKYSLVNEYLKNFPIFKTNFQQIAESSVHNVFYNKNLFVDTNGQLKSTFEMNSRLGYYLRDILVSNVNIHNIFNKINNIWNLQKNDIEICKDCELRLICVDCRVPFKNSEYWSFKEDCPYNPYISKWNNENDFIPVLECGSYNETGKFVVNKEKVDSLNQQLWGNKLL